MGRAAEGGPAAGTGWRALSRLGAASVLLAVLVVLAEIAIGLLPGVAEASRQTGTVAGWFALFQSNGLLGLRNLGLLNVLGAALLTPAFLAIYLALRRENEPWAALGALLFFMGMGVYLASYRGFAMLALSGQYAQAATDAQRTLLLAAGQAMLAEGSSRLGLWLIDAAGLALSALMLRGRSFSRATGYAGLAGNGLMLALEIVLVFPPAWRGAWMLVAMPGGVAIMVWYVLVGIRLMRMEPDSAESFPGPRSRGSGACLHTG